MTMQNSRSSKKTATNKVLIISAGMGFTIAGLLILNMFSKSTTMQIFGKLIEHGPMDKKCIALTFDDGPDPDNTPVILDVLARHDVIATFFMVGEQIQKHKDLAQRVVGAGHQVANHSLTHQRMIFRGPRFIRDEIEATDRLLRAVGYEGEIQFRPPYGRKLFVLPWVLRKMGKTTVLWNVESHDTETQQTDILVKNIFDKIVPGSIVLFHDGGATKPGTWAALDQTIIQLKTQGYNFSTVLQLMNESKNVVKSL